MMSRLAKPRSEGGKGRHAGTVTFWPTDPLNAPREPTTGSQLHNRSLEVQVQRGLEFGNCIYRISSPDAHRRTALYYRWQISGTQAYGML
ncbi:hypothetical protein J6590_045063 [Homalodisca vitripennis]|nr:hypothetical protein J6590_045063 [Homalodisca vitripennis]